MVEKNERSLSEVLESLDATGWDDPAGANAQAAAVCALEDGKVLFFPRLGFALSPEETRFLSPGFADARSKNVSFDPQTDTVKHAVGTAGDIAEIAAMMRRYHDCVRRFLQLLVPNYADAAISGRTSFRPVEVLGRKLSPRKDDSRLHVDAFPSTPTGGTRILRVFTNVNPHGRQRDWRLGAPFEDVARQFMPAIKPQLPGSARLLNAIGATKTLRTPYDHLMLAMHDTMKGDDTYQIQAAQTGFRFPPGSTWIVYTDKTSHAAMAGQHVFEQTFYLPVAAMADPSKSPLRILERLAGHALA
jgi:3-deoxy-D-manno-oct-2-ulosonic acid (Kdo) hydroxylase